MRLRTRAIAAMASFLALTGTSALAAAPADALSSPPTITVTMTDQAITLSSGTSLHAGRVIFRVVTPSGDHALQLAKLMPGYSLQQAGADLNASFGGNVPAIKRVDKNIHFLGGAETMNHHPGYFSETLYAGTYYLIDQNSSAMTTLHVYGTPTPRSWIANSSTITAYNYGFGSASVLPHAGWTLFRDKSDEPHFVVMLHVKPGTTAKDVQAYIDSGMSDQTPSFGLPESTSSGVISPQDQILWHYNMPAGRYVLACFWPDDDSGMPHFVMGMWKIVDLR